MHSTYFDTLRSLSQPIRAADLPQTLEPMRRLLDALGNPQKNFGAIVVTGSTGKGTTCLNLAYKFHAQGRKVGLYTSPHLHLFRERFALLVSPDGSSPRNAEPQNRSRRLITQREFVEIAQSVFAAQDSLDHHYSTFESATAIALLWFAQQQIEIAILEIGIGGRFDAVNAVANILAVFTPIEAEHVAMLGGSPESVAWHKAGIIQPNGKAITVPQTPEVMAVLEYEAHEKHGTLEVTDDPVEAMGRGDGLLRKLAGRPYINHDKDRRSLPGRFEAITVNGRRVIIDGGHTPAAARHLRDFINEADAESIRFVFGMLRDKNAADTLRVFDAPNVQFVYTQAPSERALSPNELLERYTPTQASVTLVPSLDEALMQIKTAKESLYVVAGSLRMAAAAREAYGLLSAEDLDEARLTRAIFEGEDYQRKIR
ncbi:MAG: cyanophycin synthetase [Chloroflexota bacterium]